jgi:hypothetical protein
MKILISLISICFVISPALTAFAIHETGPSETQTVLPGPDAQKLYEYIMKSEPYQNGTSGPVRVNSIREESLTVPF